MALTKQKPRAGELWICIESYADCRTAETLWYSRGLKLDGSHEAVRAHPTYWADAATPDDELRRLREKFYADAGADFCPPTRSLAASA